MTAELVEFLRERLAEDEQAATDGGTILPMHWAADPPPSRHDVRHQVIGPVVGGVIADHVGDWESVHIARHDPARVLRDIEAKRRIIDEYESEAMVIAPGLASRAWTEGGQAVRLELITDWAQVHADHPDYRETWKP